MSRRSHEDDIFSSDGRRPGAHDGASAPQSAKREAGPQRTLLVLSRDPLPESVTEHLRARGLVVVACDSALRAAALLVKRSPDAFYFSTTGLGADGCEVAGLAREHAPEAVVVVGLGSGERSRAARLLRAGADGYLLEPLVAEELLALLERAWARREAAYREARRVVGRRALSRLARVIAHQVNNPLGTLSGWLQMLISDPDGSAVPLSKVAESARVELERLERVVETLLILSEQTAPRRGILEVEELVRSVLEGAPQEAGPLQVRVEAEVPPVLAQEETMREALRELLFGGVLRSAGTGVLELAVSLNGRMVELDALLADGGLGEAQLEELLDPLRVFDEEGGEAALALARAVGVVRVHGGEVTVERELDGRTHLRVKLPVATG